ncbi:MAG: hypothetical protein AAGE84_28495 [Cyanobacteria bacterium P01_G01_bin.39]
MRVGIALPMSATVIVLTWGFLVFIARAVFHSIPLSVKSLNGHGAYKLPPQVSPKDLLGDQKIAFHSAQRLLMA